MSEDISAVTILAMGHGDRETNLRAVQKSFLDKLLRPPLGLILERPLYRQTGM